VIIATHGTDVRCLRLVAEKHIYHEDTKVLHRIFLFVCFVLFVV